MKRILLFTIVLAMLLPCVTYSAEPTGTVTAIETYEAPKATAYYQDTPIFVDADLCEWENVPKYYLTYRDYTKESGETLYQSDSAYFMITWDETGIYQATFLPDSTKDLDPAATRDWYTHAYNLGTTEGPLKNSFSVCTVNCDSWHPNLSNYDVLDVGIGGYLVADGTIQLQFKYVEDGVVVESYLPFIEAKRSTLTDGTVMGVSIRYDDGRDTDYKYDVKHYRYLWGDDNEVIRDDASKMGQVTLSSKKVSNFISSVNYKSERLAEDLKTLGLFLGTENGFELDRVPTRIEALVMLIRLLGVENDAKNGTWSHPFTDVPDWAAPYVGYAYEKGLTAGVSDTLFGTDELSNAAQYLTFVLRALGYSDTDGDFVWNEAYKKASEIQLIEENQYTEGEKGEFLRGDVVEISYNALTTLEKGKTTMLIEKLIENQAVDADIARDLSLYGNDTFEIISGKKYVKKDYQTQNTADEDYESITIPKGTLVLDLEKDFGAVGDGITDDGAAVQAAFLKLSAMKGTPCLLEFGKDKTYRLVKYAYNQYIIYLMNAENVYVNGNGSTMMFTYPARPMYIENCKNITIFDLKMDNDPIPFVLGNVKDVNVRGGYCTFTTEVEMNLEIGETYDCPGTYFALPNLDTRGFMNITRYERVDENIYKAYLQDPGLIKNYVSFLGKSWIMPNPGIAHLGSLTEAASYHIFYSSDIHLANVRIYANNFFLFSVSGNLGEIRFSNVDIKPRENAEVQKIASWRDGFHCKENRGPVIWERCYIGNLGDDAFNICCTIQAIQEIKETAAGKVYTLRGVGQYATGVILAGDTFDAYNVETGEYIGRGTVKEVVGDKSILLEEELEGLDNTSGIRLAFDSLASPGSQIIDCYVKGTARFKGNVTIKNTTFDFLEIWEMVEGDIEGPIPKDVVFEDCTFINGFITFDAINRETGAVFPDIAKHIDVTFINCSFEKGAYLKVLNGANVIEK